MYNAKATMQLFGLFLKTRIGIVFQVFTPKRNFLLDNLLCFGHHNTLRSLIKANIRTVTMKRFHKIVLPKYGHKHWTNWLVSCFTVYNQHLRHRNHLRCFVIVSNSIFSSFKWFAICYCSSTDFDGFGGNREQLNIPLVP